MKENNSSLISNNSSLNVLVTGGSGEIGSAICKKFAENGFNVIITYNSNSEKAEKLLAELNEISSKITHNSSLITHHSNTSLYPYPPVPTPSAPPRPSA